MFSSMKAETKQILRASQPRCLVPAITSGTLPFLSGVIPFPFSAGCFTTPL